MFCRNCGNELMDGAILFVGAAALHPETERHSVRTADAR